MLVLVLELVLESEGARGEWVAVRIGTRLPPQLAPARRVQGRVQLVVLQVEARAVAPHVRRGGGGRGEKGPRPLLPDESRVERAVPV